MSLARRLSCSAAVFWGLASTAEAVANQWGLSFGCAIAAAVLSFFATKGAA